MNGVWIEFGCYLILLGLFIHVFIRGSFTTLHRIYLLFHLFMLNWPLGQTVLYMAEHSEFRLYIMKIMFVCLSALGYGWYVFSVFLTGRSYVLSARTLIWNAVPSALTALIIMWNPSGMFIQETGTRLTEGMYGPLFWLLVAVLAGYMLRAIAIMVGTLRRDACTDHLRKQVQMALRGLLLFLLFGLIDITVNVILDTNGRVVPGLLSMGMMLSGLYFVIAIQRNRLFDLVQFAQQDVFNSMTTGIIVINEQSVVADINRVMLPIMPIRIGDRFEIRKLLNVMGAVSDQTELFIEWHEANSPERLEMEVLVPHSSSQKSNHVVIMSVPIESKKEGAAGRIITIQDVTDYRLLLEETRRQNETLHQQNQELLTMQEELSAANRKLERMAVTDSLTGCYNRRYLLNKLEGELPRLAQSQSPFAVILFDIDLFKSINDTYGHLAGDAILVNLAETIQGVLRPSDVLARYGGEEFTIYLPNMNMKQAAEVAERVRAAVERSALRWDNSTVDWNGEAMLETAASSISDQVGMRDVSDDMLLAITISMGVVGVEALQPQSAREPAAYLRQLLAAADDALYEAKNSGRNQVICRKFNP